MAICITLNADGTFTPTGEAVESCSGYVIVSGSEYGLYQAVNDAFAQPTSQVAESWFFGAWGAVMVMFIAGRCVGAVLSMFKGK